MNSSLSAKRTNIERSRLFALGLPNMLKNAPKRPTTAGQGECPQQPLAWLHAAHCHGLEASTGPPATPGEDRRQHSTSPPPAPVPVLGKGTSRSTFPSSGRALHLPCPQLHTSAGIKSSGVWVCMPRTSSTPCLEQTRASLRHFPMSQMEEFFNCSFFCFSIFFRARYADNIMHFL